MKNILKRLLFLCSSLIICWFLYGIFSFSDIPYADYNNISTDALNTNYTEQIQQAQSYLSTIPEKINTPSFSVAVGINGEVIWSAAVGQQNIENKIAATPETIYRIGSTSKAVTSTLAATLYESGELNLEKPIAGDIENYPNKKWSFTPRQLLSHSAGIPDYEDLRIHGLYSTLCNCKNYKSVTESLNIFNDVKLQYEPQTAYEYTSLDYILLSAYLEDIGNDDFLKLLDQRVFQRCDMYNSFGDHSAYVKGNIASFYETKNHKYRNWKTFGIIPNEIDLSYKWAGGGILSTPSDLVKMGNAILTDSTFLSEETQSVFFEPQRLKSGDINPQHYALGWRSYPSYKNEKFLKEVWMVHHGGISKGSMNFLVLFPDYDMVIDASINTKAKDFLIFWEEVMQLASYFLNEEI
jgi:CubicO group peptidase (beta-lactamase class C family)